MVNPGAIATASYVPGASADEKWGFLRNGLSRFAGRPLHLDDEVYRLGVRHEPPEPRARRGAREPRWARLRPRDAVDIYTRQSCLERHRA